MTSVRYLSTLVRHAAAYVPLTLGVVLGVPAHAGWDAPGGWSHAQWPRDPVYAQWGGLLQDILQKRQEIQAKEDVKRAEEQAEAERNPTKKWPSAKPVPADVQAAASAFAVKAPSSELRPLFERLYIEGERNATLNLQRIGLAALSAGDLATAEKAFDGAIVRIDLVYADNPEAQKAKSLWSAEAVKDYKGEPYERAMTYFYRGLVYAARNDFQNARAMFKQADYQDTVAEQEKFAGDFALMPYLAGWASHCDGNSVMALDFQQQARKADPAYGSLSAEQPVLVLLETGRAPFKYAGGRYGEALKWHSRSQGQQRVQSACLEPGGGNCPVNSFALGADVGFQATTRGGRAIDAVLNGKASFKEGAEKTAEVANALGLAGMQVAAMSGNRDAAGFGLFGALAGAIAQGAASSTRTQADIREWEQLPSHIWLGTAETRLPSQDVLARVDAGGEPGERKVRRLVDGPVCQLYWGRGTPLSDLAAEAGPLEPGEHRRDAAFRQEIASDFAL